MHVIRSLLAKRVANLLHINTISHSHSRARRLRDLLNGANSLLEIKSRELTMHHFHVSCSNLIFIISRRTKSCLNYIMC